MGSWMMLPFRSVSSTFWPFYVHVSFIASAQNTECNLIFRNQTELWLAFLFFFLGLIPQLCRPFHSLGHVHTWLFLAIRCVFQRVWTMLCCSSARNSIGLESVKCEKPVYKSVDFSNSKKVSLCFMASSKWKVSVAPFVLLTWDYCTALLGVRILFGYLPLSTITTSQKLSYKAASNNKNELGRWGKSKITNKVIWTNSQ